MIKKVLLHWQPGEQGEQPAHESSPASPAVDEAIKFIDEMLNNLQTSEEEKKGRNQV